MYGLVAGLYPQTTQRCLPRNQTQQHDWNPSHATRRKLEMADADDVRRIARALPAVVEIDSDGFDFRIAGKGFVWSYPERRPGKRRRIRTDIAVLYVGDEAEKQALVLGEPTVFFSTPGYDGWPLVLLRLAEVDVERLAELVTDAWRMRAPVDVTKRGECFGPPGSRRLGSSTASPPPTTSR